MEGRPHRHQDSAMESPWAKSWRCEGRLAGNGASAHGSWCRGIVVADQAPALGGGDVLDVDVDGPVTL